VETNYIKTREKINENKNSINSKIFMEMEEWHKLADNEKEEKIKLQYENKFLTNRNNDLESRIK
jgi:hypothetical protein